MKNLIILFFSITLLSLAFVGCQTNEDLTSPVDLDKKQPIVIPIAVNGDDAGVLTEVDLIAGNTAVCGHITVKQIEESRTLELWYYADDGWMIMETHAAAGAYPSYLPIDETTGYPLMGYFEHNEFYENGVTEAGPIYITIPLTSNWKRMVFVGAHAIVKNCQGTVVTADICPEFPVTALMTPTWTPSDATLYTVKAVFDFTSDVFYGFCLDNSRYIAESSGARTVQFICSYDQMPVCTPPQYFIEKPENLDLINWIINNRETNWDRRTIQAAIWSLINPSGPLTDWQNSTLTDGEWRHDPILREAIITAARAHGEGFIPECDEYVFVIVYGPGEICNPLRQVVGIIVPVECEPGDCSEDIIAWAFNVTIDGSGKLVPDGTSAQYTSRYWYRFFGYFAF